MTTTNVLQKFTVIGFIEESGQVISHLLYAQDGQSAFSAAAAANDQLILVASLPGWLQEGTDVTYPGSGTVDASVVLEQPEVFGVSPYQVTAADVLTVLEEYSLRITDTQGKSFATMADELIDEINQAEVMTAALAEPDVSAMQQAAFNAIFKQLVVLGVLEF